MRYPLLPDEETGPLERVLAVADSGNGVASALDIRRWQFINPELTVHLQREAALANGSAWTPGPSSPPAGRAWRHRSCPTSTARSAPARSPLLVAPATADGGPADRGPLTRGPPLAQAS